MTKISEITICGYKSIDRIEKLPLNAINVLIGANGSGKSNFLKVFELIRAVRTQTLNEFVIREGGANRILHFGAGRTQKVSVEINLDGSIAFYRLEVLVGGADNLAVNSERLIIGPSSRSSRQAFEGWVVYSFLDTGVTSPLRQTPQIDDNRALRSDGSNLPAILNLLHQKYLGCYQMICQVTRQVAPFFRDFQLIPQNLRPDSIKLEWLHTGTDKYFDAASLSSGTIRFIALATLLLQPAELRPELIVIDEPELGLHPAAITLLASMIKQASTESQIIVSTQSTNLLDHFDPEDVLVAERADGGTKLRRLSSEQLSGWLEDYSLGQLWEKNEIGGRPVPER